MSCGVLTRSCAERRLSSGRSSTAISADSRVHRRQQERCGRWSSARGRAHLHGVAGGSEHVLRGEGPPLSARAWRDAELVPRLVELWQANYEVYGSRKLWKAARRAGIDIGRDQTRRLMGQAGIQGAPQGSGSGPRGVTATAGGTRIWPSGSSSPTLRTGCG